MPKLVLAYRCCQFWQVYSDSVCAVFLDRPWFAVKMFFYDNSTNSRALIG